MLTIFNTICCCCSVTKSCPALCNSMDCSMPGSSVLYYLPEFAQIHAHWVSDVIYQLILCRPLLLSPSVFPSIRVFSNELALCIRWPKYWNFSLSISASNEYSGLISFKIDWFDLLAVQFSSVQSLSRVRLFVTPWTVAHQAPLSSTISQSLLKFMSVKSVMLSNHLILCHPLLLLSQHLSQHQGLFQWVVSSHQVAKVLELQLQQPSFQWIFKAGFAY